MNKESLKNYIRLLEFENYSLEEYIDYQKSSQNCPCKTSIIQKPAKFRPDNGQDYYYVSANGLIEDDAFSKTVTIDFYRYNAGNCFDTEDEITEEIKDAILEEMKGGWESNEPK